MFASKTRLVIKNNFIFSRCSISWLCTTLSITLDITGRGKRGLQFFGSEFFALLNMSITFAVLQPSGNSEPNGMLTICDIGSANISASSYSILQGI